MREWVERLVVILAVMFMLGSTTAHEGVAASQGSQTVIVTIDGMTCGACVKDVKVSLAKVPGVNVVEFRVGKKGIFFSDYSDVRASVTFDPEKTGVEALLKAIAGASSPLSAYTARLVKP